MQDSPRQVLFVDDDAFLSQLYATLLRKEGLGFATAGSGAEAIRQLSASRPDLVVLDLNLPDITGVEVLRHIRGTQGLADLPVIIFSNGFIQALVDEVGTLGARKFLSKLQCPPKKLVEEIKQTLASLSIPGASALEAASGQVEEEPVDQLPKWLQRLESDPRPQARKVCLLHLYRTMRETLRRAVDEPGETPRGKLGRAVMELLDDLYGHPGHATPSTVCALGAGLAKLNHLCAQADSPVLGSEVQLRNVLDDLEP